MDNLYILLFVLCCGVVGFVNGSLQLTTFPAEATEGKAYTLMFSSTNNISASKIIWYWRNVSVVETRYLYDTCEVVVPQNAYFDTYLSTRVSISCGVLQHNLTLRINSTVDNGTLWYCKDPSTGETSQTVTIDVTDEPTHSTSVTTTPASATPTITTDEEIVSSTFSPISTSTGTGTGNETASTPATSSPTSTDTTQSVGQTSVTSTKPENQLPIIYIAVGGSIAVVIIIIIVVSIVLLRRRKARTVKLADDDKVVKTTEV